MEIERLGPGYYQLKELGPNQFNDVYIDANNNVGKVWIDTYTKENADPEYYQARSSMTTYGWLDADAAEAVALAILEAVSEARIKKRKRV